MDKILYILLLPTALILGIANSENSCHKDNCNSTETDVTSADESEIDLFSLDSDPRELHMDGCSNLAILVLTPNLRTLEMFNCSWDTINRTELRAVANLSTLRMRGGELLKLDSDQFVELPHLEILELGENQIKVVSEDTFKGLSQMWMLTLNDNYIITLHEKLFHPLPELRHLDLSNNRINGLPEGIFANNPNLQLFRLRDARFLNLSPKSLRPLKNLIFLDLSNNYFMDLQITGAESIRLLNSGIHNLRIEGTVSKLHARENYLENLDIENKATVTELDLYENSLDTADICRTLQGMWRLEHLDISKNILKELPIFTNEKLGEVFLLPNLRFVNMSKNWVKHLRADSPLFSPSLTHLDLSYNKIRSIEPHTFGMASKLQRLYIQGNLLVYFQYELFHHQQRGLEAVALYKNEFSQNLYEKIKKYFKNAGVLVLEENQEAFSKAIRTKNETFQALMIIRRVHSKRQRKPAHRQSADLHIFRKLSTWNILILLSLLAALTVNAILILHRLRSSDKRAWRRRRASKIKTGFLNRKGSKI